MGSCSRLRRMDAGQSMGHETLALHCNNPCSEEVDLSHLTLFMTNSNPPLNGRVFCLVPCLEYDLFESCTLNFSTIRKAFPTCEITIHVNGNSLWKERI